MEELLQKAKIDNIRIRKFVFTITATELSKMSEPCYFPTVKKYCYELLRLAGLTEKDISLHVRKFYYGHQASKWKFHTDPKSNFYIFLMYYFLKNNDIIAYSSMMTFYTIRNYANLMRKHWPKYCKEEVWRYTLEKIVKNHLFSREKTISGGLFFLARELRSRYTEYIQNGDLEGIVKFITEARHRVSQSVKSFAETYYRMNEKGVSIMQSDEDDINTFQQKTLSNNIKVVEDTVKLLVVYKYVDKKAFNIARSLTKANQYVSKIITEKLLNSKYTDSIKIALNLFVKDLKNVSDICGPGYIKYVKKKMVGKKMGQKLTFKMQIVSLTYDLLDEIGEKERYDNAEAQALQSITSFVAFYITGVLRNSIC